MAPAEQYLLESCAYMFGLPPYMCGVLFISTDSIKCSDTVHMCIDEQQRSPVGRFTASTATTHVTA